jgi:tetratricopeptide (TPR) repeat protein
MSDTGPARLIAAKTAVEKALSLDHNLSEAHAVLASIKLRLELDWNAAERERLAALKLNPKSPDILYESALNLATMGRPTEALRMLERAVRMDSGSASVARLRHAGHVYLWTRQYDRAIRKYSEVMSITPSSKAWMHECLAEAYLAKGDYREAIRHGRNARPLSQETLEQMKTRHNALEKAFNEGQERGYWEQQLEFENLRSDANHLMRLAAIYARIGKRTEAFNLLHDAYRNTPTEFAYSINTDSSFDSLRSERKWNELMDKLWRKK